jgi:hypothetical protein
LQRESVECNLISARRRGNQSSQFALGGVSAREPQDREVIGLSSDRHLDAAYPPGFENRLSLRLQFGQLRTVVA